MTDDFDVGVQSVAFQEFGLTDLLEELATTDVTHLELWGRHLSPGHDEATVAAGLDALADAAVSVCGYGVVDLEDPAAAREHVAFADRLGAGYVTVNYPPTADAVTEELTDLAVEFGVDVAIHNYSSVHHDDLSAVFSTMADVRDVLARHDDPRLGLCVDTGHFLVEAVTPEDVLREFGDRTVAVHLKDTSEAEPEDLPGAGRLDLPTVLGLVDDHTDLAVPPVIEYELPQDRATEALREAVANVHSARDS